MDRLAACVHVLGHVVATVTWLLDLCSCARLSYASLSFVKSCIVFVCGVSYVARFGDFEVGPFNGEGVAGWMRN